MWNIGVRIGHQILEALKRQLLSRLTRQHHEHYPFELFRVELVGIQRQHALNDYLTLLGRQYSKSLEGKQKPAALGRQSRQLTVGKNPYDRALTFVPVR